MQKKSTRRVRAIEERFYGRTGRRMFYVSVERGAGDGDQLPLRSSTTSRSRRASRSAAYPNGEAAGASSGTHGSPRLRRREFWQRMAELVAEFDRLPRKGETNAGLRRRRLSHRPAAGLARARDRLRQDSVTICGRGMALDIVARDAEIASNIAFVERTDEGFGALVLEGEAGVGKLTRLAPGGGACACLPGPVRFRLARGAECWLSHTVWAISSIISSMSYCQRCHSGGDAHSRLRCYAKRPQTIPSISARSPWRSATHFTCWRSAPACWLRSTTLSGRPGRVERARVRAAAAEEGLGWAAARMPAGMDGVGAPLGTELSSSGCSSARCA